MFRLTSKPSMLLLPYLRGFGFCLYLIIVSNPLLFKVMYLNLNEGFGDKEKRQGFSSGFVATLDSLSSSSNNTLNTERYDVGCSVRLSTAGGLGMCPGRHVRKLKSHYALSLDEPLFFFEPFTLKIWICTP
ncbi:MAG: hypothetical protein EXX96DRAFT_543002 [Benjaminiella poitrasii]|nr:MAG: hypothetical protein EXX96DRAFT_543002 [Benjaminiella poitrasii]